MQSARLLIRLRRAPGFAFVANSIEQDRTDRVGMRGYLREQFPQLRTADDAAALAFAKARAKRN